MSLQLPPPPLMNVITLYIGPRILLGMIQRPLQFAGTESRLCGEHLHAFQFLIGFFTLQNRYLTKICDQVVALLSAEQSASIVWNDDDSDTKSADMTVGESDSVHIRGGEDERARRGSSVTPRFPGIFPSSRSCPFLIQRIKDDFTSYITSYCT